MSDGDDDDYGGYGGDDYEDPGDLPDDTIPAVGDDESDEPGLEEDAAGSDEDDESDDNDDGASDAGSSEFPEPAKAKPEKQKVDPILRVSNRSTVTTIVPDDDRVTSNCLSKAEASYLISMRAEQISKNSTCFVDVGDIHDPVALAFKELIARKCPLKLRRRIGSGPGGESIVEEWDVRAMVYPPLTPPVHLGSAAKA